MDQQGRPEAQDWVGLAGLVRGMRRDAIVERTAEDNLAFQREVRPRILAEHDEKIRLAKMEYDTKQDIQRREAGGRDAIAVSALMDSGDNEAAGRLAANWYNRYVPDGHTGEFMGVTPEGGFKFAVDDGQGGRAERVLSRANIETGMQGWVAKDPVAFLEGRKKEKLDIHNFNVAALQKPQVFVGKEGVVLGVLAKDDTGRASLQYTDTYGRRLDTDAVKSGGYQPLGVLDELDERKRKKLGLALAQFHYDEALDDPKRSLAKIENEALALQEAMFQRGQVIDGTEDPYKKANLQSVQEQAAQRLGFLEDQMERGSGPSERALTAVTSAARAEWKNMSVAEREMAEGDEEAYVTRRMPQLLEQWNGMRKAGRMSSRLSGGGKPGPPPASKKDAVPAWEAYLPKQRERDTGATGSW